MIDPELQQRLSTIPWLSACGGEPEVVIDFVRVDSWQAALAAHGRRACADATLEAHNELRIFLKKKHPGRSSDWNAVAQEAMECLAEKIDPALIPAAEKHGLGKEFLEATRADKIEARGWSEGCTNLGGAAVDTVPGLLEDE